MDFISTRFKIERLDNDVQRLPSQLHRAIAALPAITATPASDLDEAELHAPLFRFLKTAESVAARIQELSTPGIVKRDAVRDLEEKLLRTCTLLTTTLDEKIRKITPSDLEMWAGEARVFMLRESKKRVMAVMEDMLTHTTQKVAIGNGGSAVQIDVTIPGSLPAGSPPRVSRVSTRSDNSSRASTPRPIHGCGSPEGDGETGVFSSAPKLKNIIRLGSYQNAGFFSGSPVAVKPKKKGSAAAVVDTMVQGSSSLDRRMNGVNGEAALMNGIRGIQVDYKDT